MKAAKAGTRVELMVQSYVANVYFWCRSTPASLGAEWKDYELVFRLPAKGEPDYQEQMKAIRARFDLPAGEGTVWIDDVRLVEVEPLDEWQSLQAMGFDRQLARGRPALRRAGERRLAAQARLAGVQARVPADPGGQDRAVPGSPARILADHRGARRAGMAEAE